MYFVSFLILLISFTLSESAFIPKIKNATVLGILEDASLNRDSCGSAIFGNRALWVCRDTQPFNATAPMICNSASWTDLPSRGGGTNLNMYGDNQWRSYFPLVPGNCSDNEEGLCSDGTRYPHWQDSPPLVTFVNASVTVGYVFMTNWHIIGLEPLVKDPSTALYRVTYQNNSDPVALPKAELVDPAFWGEREIPFGVYGSLVSNGTAYLWAKDSNWKVTLARVPVDKIEDKRSYEYSVYGQWTTKRPPLGEDAATIENGSAGGQGTYYYSPHWQRYVWIGQAQFSVSADFFITTAPEPQGPWEKPELVYQSENGNATLPAYSIQAHPGLGDPEKNEIYLTYTKVDRNHIFDKYTTPLIKIEWE